ncbi:hypothetical protein UK23_33365 [Lentzea aerocolonigenes]|uniref:Uncharacterized protein n=1 Tax=Lentzea aerocolonigenes TaxID=68170 RepID=A0A0F0GJ87_LENAE|nr:hypothetical protein [Lentzea aerocolonigenes]KJK43410.1 hypothetical protein UK23_33365 [Lentzea aerocolonigenes]
MGDRSGDAGAAGLAVVGDAVARLWLRYDRPAAVSLTSGDRNNKITPARRTRPATTRPEKLQADRGRDKWRQDVGEILRPGSRKEVM